MRRYDIENLEEVSERKVVYLAAWFSRGENRGWYMEEGNVGDYSKVSHRSHTIAGTGTIVHVYPAIGHYELRMSYEQAKALAIAFMTDAVVRFAVDLSR